MEIEWTERNSKDLSRNGFVDFPEDLLSAECRGCLLRLELHHNRLGFIPPSIQDFSVLNILDISNNSISHISEEISHLKNLKVLLAKNNNLDNDSLPKTLDQLQDLHTLNLGGNKLTSFPPQLVHMPKIQKLYLGSNKITEIPNTIHHMNSLEILNLGDNLLVSIPEEFGDLTNLSSLNLACNRMKSLPRSLIHLHKLKSLSLHNNRLETLPPEIVSINLIELSLRNNPLVVRFVQSMTFEVPSLLELSGRVIKLSHLTPPPGQLPYTLDDYLRSANKCVNPRCKGVFFSAKVEHVKFVDFCGKYKLPLLQYLCSPNCSDSQPYVEGSTSDSESDEEMSAAIARMKKVLLG